MRVPLDITVECDSHPCLVAGMAAFIRIADDCGIFYILKQSC